MQSWSSLAKRHKLGKALNAVHVAGFTSAAELIDCNGAVAESPSPYCTLNPFPQQNDASNEIYRELYPRPNPQGSQPDYYSELVTLLGECVRQKTLDEGRKLHKLIVCTSLGKKVFLSHLLIKMYDTCCQLMDARSVFDGMQSRNVVTWTLIMNAYIHHGDRTGAIFCFREMHAAGIKPSNVTLCKVAV